MASGRLIDYLGQGDLADRPSVPDLASGGLALYYATDESTLYVYSDNGWEVVTSAASWVSSILAGLGIVVDDTDPENPEISVDVSALDFVESVVAGTGVTVDNTDPRNPVISATGGGIPDAPSDGTIYGRKDGEWEPITGGSGGDARNTVSALSTSGSVDIDYALGDYFTLALSGDVSGFTFSNLPGPGKGATLMILIIQDSTPRTVTWPASFKWAGGSPGEISTDPGAVDVLAITTFDNGTTWAATLAKAFS